MAGEQATAKAEASEIGRLPINVIAYNVPEAAAAVGLSESTLWKEMKAGNLRWGRRCGRRLILRADLEAFLLSGWEA